MITTIGAYLTAWLASKWLSWIGTLVSWVWWGISRTIKGTLSFAQDPRELFAVIVIGIACFAFGAWSMWGFVGHRVKTVEAQLLDIWQDMSNKDREDAQRAAEARAARAAAEAAERQRQINEANTAKLPPLKLVAPAVPAGAAGAADSASADGVRSKPTPVRRRQCEQGLFGCL